MDKVNEVKLYIREAIKSMQDENLTNTAGAIQLTKDGEWWTFKIEKQ